MARVTSFRKSSASLRKSRERKSTEEKGKRSSGAKFRSIFFKKKSSSQSVEEIEGSHAVGEACHFAVELDRCALEDSTGVPSAFGTIWDALHENRVETHEGVFRIPGDHGRVSKLRAEVDACGPNNFPSLRNESVADIGGLFKLWIKELPSPIVQAQFHSAIIAASKSHDEAAVVELVSSLPKLNLAVLCQLCQLLKHISTNSEQNKMTSKNLAVVFAPETLRIGADDAMAAMQSMEAGIWFLTFIIDNFHRCFSDASLHRTIHLSRPASFGERIALWTAGRASIGSRGRRLSLSNRLSRRSSRSSSRLRGDENGTNSTLNAAIAAELSRNGSIAEERGEVR